MLGAGLTPEHFRALIAGKAGPKRGARAGDGRLLLARNAALVAGELAQADGRGEANADDVLLALVREPRGTIARALSEAKLKPSQLRQLVRPSAARSGCRCEDSCGASPRERAAAPRTREAAALRHLRANGIRR